MSVVAVAAWVCVNSMETYSYVRSLVYRVAFKLSSHTKKRYMHCTRHFRHVGLRQLIQLSPAEGLNDYNIL